jgi:exonuclease SbcC
LKGRDNHGSFNFLYSPFISIGIWHCWVIYHDPPSSYLCSYKEKIMLKSLSIKNFQSHKKTALEFHPGINVITGASDSGKTAIIRALRWLVYNRPTGEAFRSSWGGETTVSLSLDNYSIQRTKDKAQNSYWLDSMEFKAFGTDVPEEIQQVLNLNDINIQQQLDRPFLLDDSPGEVAAHFNRVAHLDIIDKGLQNVQKWTRTIEQDIKSGEQQQIMLQKDLVSYDYLEKMEVDIEVLEQMESQRTTTIQQKQKIQSLVDNIEEVQKQIKTSSELLPAGKQVDNVLELFTQITDIKEKKQSLYKVIVKLQSIQQSLQEHESILQTEKQVDMILSLYEKQDKQIRETEGLSSLIDSIQKTKEQIKEKELSIMEMQQDFDHYMPAVCPLCEQEIK